VTAAVLDASAVLALLHEEPGASEVAPWIGEGAISTVNAAEVVGKLIEAGMPDGAALDALDGLGLDDPEMGAQAGILRGRTRALGLSLGDRACLATALVLDMPVVTADRNWGQLDVGLQVHLVR
jgi:PIN domain nuclease of toxin-antitoxin system